MSNCTLNWGQIFFINLSLWPTTIFLSFWFIACFVWYPMKKKFEQQKLPPIPFEYKYLIDEKEYDEAHGSDISGNWDKNYIIVNTPKGNVLIKYSIEEEGFEYWADKIISYPHLEVCARKYVKTFSCIKLYIDRRLSRVRKRKRIITFVSIICKYKKQTLHNKSKYLKKTKIFAVHKSSQLSY